MRISKSKEQLKNILADTISHLSGIFTVINYLILR